MSPGPSCADLRGCATTDGAYEEGEPVVLESQEQQILEEEQTLREEDTPKTEEGEVPLPVAESEPPADASADEPAEVVVGALRERHEMISTWCPKRSLLRDVELSMSSPGREKGSASRPSCRLCLWSEAKKEWSVAHIEIPRPPVKWKPGGKPMPFKCARQGSRHGT